MIQESNSYGAVGENNDEKSLKDRVQTNCDSSDEYIPSYVRLSCAVSGYSAAIKYDALRETCLEKGPTGISASHKLGNVRETTTSSNEGYDGRGETLHTKRTLTSSSSIKNKNRGSSEKEKMESPQNNMNGHSTMHYKRIVKYEHYSETSSKSILTSEDAFTRLSAESNGEEGKKSFIQQRIERLYGPAALGMAFQAKRALLERMKEKEEVVEKEIPITKEPPQGLPSVFRHLRPEFRYQLPVKSKRNDLFQNNLVRFDDIHDRNANNSSVAPSQKLSDVKVKSVNGNVNNDSKSWRTLSKELESISKGVETLTKPVESKETITQNGSRSPDKRIPEVEDVPKLEKAKDGNYFLEVVGAEIARLEPEIARIEEDLKLSDDAMTEEVRGKLMAISGKARLLLSQKVEQFRGLCYQNINKKETDEFVTTNEDLAGFWDMVNIQVDAVKDMLKEVDELRRNDWKEKIEPLVPQGGKGGTSTIARSGTNPSQRRTQTAPKDPKATEKSLAAKKVREEQRRKMREALAAKRLEASKAAASSSSQSAEQGVEIFVSKKP